jgi:hypothetical protein
VKAEDEDEGATDYQSTDFSELIEKQIAEFDRPDDTQ